MNTFQTSVPRNPRNTLSFRTRSRAFGALLALVAGAACIGHVACSKEPTALVVSVATDMALVADLDEVGLYVGVDGEVKTSVRAEVSEDRTVKLPGTLSILQPKNESTPVHIRIAGYKNGELRVVRDSIATVPSAQLTLLRMPLNWLSASHLTKSQGTRTANAGVAGNVVVRDVTGSATENFPEMAALFPGVTFPCPAGQTSSEGRCIDVNVAPEALIKVSGADLVREVYGEALGVSAETGVAEGGTCFDITSCFANEQTLKAEDIVGCKVRIPNLLANTKTLNFGLVRDPASGCKDKDCFVPLDWDGRYDEATKTYALPPEACDRLTSTDPKTRVTRVSVATNCDAKTALRPRCNALYGAVRDKAPSDPTRVPYYETPEPLPDGAAPIQDAGPDARDAAEAGPKGPTLIAKLTQINEPARITTAGSLIWVRGKIGLALIDSGGPNEIPVLPTINGTDYETRDRARFLAASGNVACTAGDTAYWCYNRTTLQTSKDDFFALAGVTPVGSAFGFYETTGVSFTGSTLNARFVPVFTNGMFGAALKPGGQALVAVTNPNGFAEIQLSGNAVALNADLPHSTFAKYPAPYQDRPAIVDIATNSTEAFFTGGATTPTFKGAIFRREFASAGATDATLLTDVNVPYVQYIDDAVPAGVSRIRVPTLAVTKDFVVWGAGPGGVRAISTCTARAVAQRSLFSGPNAAQDSVYAVTIRGTEVLFATLDGRVFSVDLPPAESCP